jgi:ribA/ribD-fused uncharacterized protein
MTINAFVDEYRFLSNFWYIPGGIILNDEHSPDIRFPTVEHAYVASKTLNALERYRIAYINKPGEAKRYGRTLPLRKDWDAVKFDIMLDLLRQKFEVPELRKKLCATGNRDLIEGNHWHDNIWGVCMCHNCTLRMESGNMLGKLLMQVRREICTQ